MPVVFPNKSSYESLTTVVVSGIVVSVTVFCSTVVGIVLVSGDVLFSEKEKLQK